MFEQLNNNSTLKIMPCMFVLYVIRHNYLVVFQIHLTIEVNSYQSFHKSNILTILEWHKQVPIKEQYQTNE
jgi:hypothetical protein